MKNQQEELHSNSSVQFVIKFSRHIIRHVIFPLGEITLDVQNLSVFLF